MRTIRHALCKKCGAELPVITDKGGLWGYANCTSCKEFNDVTDALRHGGILTGEAD